MQFQLLARLANAGGHLTMTQLADGVVHSRSGLTYQAGLLETAGLITRGPSPEDERATLVTITDDGLALFNRVLPGHIQVVPAPPPPANAAPTPPPRPRPRRRLEPEFLTRPGAEACWRRTAWTR